MPASPLINALQGCHVTSQQAVISQHIPALGGVIAAQSAQKVAA
jgi:hypothetical protein